MKRTLIPILILCGLLLAGCSGKAVPASPELPTQTPDERKLSTITPIPTSTRDSRPTETLSAIQAIVNLSLEDLQATQTARPTATRRPTQSATPTPAPVITAIPSPTQTRIPTLLPLEEGTCFLECDRKDCWSGANRLSPDGKWAYQYCSVPDMGVGVTVFRLGQDLHWNINGPKLGLQELLAGEAIYEDINFERWSSDGSAIYISTIRIGDPGPAHLYNANRLYAFHLDTGVAELIYQNGYFQFLGGDSNLFTVDTYFDRLSTTITIHHLDDGTDTLFHLPRGYYIPGSQLIWSPDYTRLLVSTGHSEIFYGDAGPFGFMYFDFSTGEARIVMENQEAMNWGDWASPIRDGEWLDGDIISILGSDNNQYYLDLNTNQFVSAPPTTPTPRP